MTIQIDSGVNIERGVLIGPAIIATPRVPYTVTGTGSARVSTTVSKFGKGSYYNNNTSGCLSVTPFSSLAFGTRNFTVEFWLYLTSTTPANLFGMRPAVTDGPYPEMYMLSDGKLYYYVNNANRIVSSASLTTNTWQSIAIVRSSGTTTLYINGTNSGTWADTTNYQAGSCIFFADSFSGGASNPIKGYADEVRISSIARYTSNYTPASSPFVTDQFTNLLIHCEGPNNSTTFTDSSNSLP